VLIETLRATEFARLDAGGHAYLDYTGSALHPASLVADHARMLAGTVLGNPHSESPASLASSALLAEARQAVRRFFRAGDEWEVVFTANASGAIRLVAEAFPWEDAPALMLAADNHNSVNGVREWAARAGAGVRVLPLDASLRIAPFAMPGGPGLFAFPAQSNFSGVRHPLALVGEAQARGWRVLLDAASFAGTSALDLSRVRPDFVSLSFYKMFGYPTGVGALLARRDALRALRRPAFAGGTVERVTVAPPVFALRDGAEGFEDGTVSFLAMPAVTAGLRWLARVGPDQVGAHAGALATELAARLDALRHRDGRPMVRRYGPRDRAGCGALVTFNVLDARGAIVPHERVEQAARDERVSVRGGCFCNPGAAEACGLGWGAPVTGAVRASLGVASSGEDVVRLLDVVERVAAPVIHVARAS
jgi:selenocysteine lyase/cysteine desulfurase